MGTLALIGLGSNLGDRKALLDGAIAALGGLPGSTLRAVSSYHETAPVGGPVGQGAFLNAAAAVETSLGPFDLLRCLQDIEKQAGRVRSVRWGERTLDLDLLLFGDLRSSPVVNRVYGGESFELQVPHPRMALRRFVLAPLAEIAPDEIDPVTRRSIADLLANLDRRPSLVTFGGTAQPLVDTLFSRLVEALNADGLSYRTQCEAYQKLVPCWDWYSNRLRDSLSSPEATNDCRKLLESWLEQLSLDLSTGRWTADASSDRWLVSDFWIDAIYDLAWPIVDDPARFLDRLLEARRGVIAPTFVIDWQGSIHEASDQRCLLPSPLGDAPILKIHPDQPVEAMIVEILTACEATRMGR